jgi:hypothetical protein
MTTEAMPDYLQQAYQEDVVNQQDFVQQFYNDIIDARVDNTPIDPLMARAELWANQWDAAFNKAELLINTHEGGVLEWHKGNTENGCDTCANLDGIRARASTWEELGVHPQGYPNDKLQCGGGGPGNFCDCTLEPTDQRQSPNAYDTIMNAVVAVG